MTIFGRVLCPLQPSCLAPLHAARALLLSSFPLVVYPHFFCFLPLLVLLLHHQNNTFHPPLGFFFCSLCPLSLASPPLLSSSSCYCAVLSFLPKPTSSAHPPSPCFTPLYCFLCSFHFHYFLCSPFLPYPSPAGSCAHPGLLHWLCTGSQGLLAPGLFWLHPCVPNQPCCTMHTCLQIH